MTSTCSTQAPWRALALLLPLVFAAAADARPSFAERQNSAARVKAARQAHDASIRERFEELGLAYPPRALLLVAQKHESTLEVWAGDDDKKALTLVERIPICAKSGTLGPKRRQGDLQVPEGFYVVDRYNPYSSYHLSLGLNYPNRADRIVGRRAPYVDGRSLGGDIFVHGDCVTIGCLPLEDVPIERVYLMALDARLAGRTVHVHVYPRALNDDGLRALLDSVDGDDPRRAFWRELKPMWDAWSKTRIRPRVRVDKKTGAYGLRTP